MINVMIMKLFISTDLETGTSGDIVASKELEAMRMLASENNEGVTVLTSNDIAPIRNGLPDIPFLIDYLTLDRLSNLDLSEIDLAHMYGGTYTQTVRFLKSKGIKTTYTCLMHDRNISIEEHEKFIGSYPFSHVKDNRLWTMYIGTIKETDIVITPGNAPKDILLREGCKRVEIIPHGCDIPDKVEPIPENFNVGYLGAIGPDKGLIYLIKAWEMLNYNDSILIFAGNQTENLSPFIRQFTNAGKFHLMGKIKYINQLYNNISVYIQPSTTEGFGMEVPEAMAHGRPVICSIGAGSADIVENNLNGFVVHRRDPKAIADKIDYLKNNPKVLKEMGQRAREKSMNYSWDKIKDTYINLWKSL